MTTVSKKSVAGWMAACRTLERFERRPVKRGRAAAHRRALAITMDLLRRGGEAKMLEALGVSSQAVAS